jgi:hypothetical protein
LPVVSSDALRDKQCHWIIEKALKELTWYNQQIQFEIEKKDSLKISADYEFPAFLQSVPNPLIRRRAENSLAILLLLIDKYDQSIPPLQRSRYVGIW